jgi:ATP-dependent helicase YprA (DUF1998 family)
MSLEFALSDSQIKTSRHTLDMAIAQATKSCQYLSENTREEIRKSFKTAFNGKDPYDWQVDICEALLLGVDCIVIAGTGAGKMMPFVMPLLMDKTLRKFAVVILPLNELENDQVCTV